MKHSHNQIQDELILRLEKTGIDSKPGKFLYSGFHTLRPGPLYFLGYNPGGDPHKESDSILAHLQRHDNETNEYMDVEWSTRGKHRDKGQALIQKRVRHLFEELGLQARDVCASNLVFVRSKNVNELNDAKTLEKQCWPLHEFILTLVEPNLIFAMGNLVYNFIKARSDSITSETTFSAGHGNWKFRATIITLLGRQMYLVSSPHFSRYAIDKKPDVIRRIRDEYLKIS